MLSDATPEERLEFITKIHGGVRRYKITYPGDPKRQAKLLQMLPLVYQQHKLNDKDNNGQQP